MKTPLKTCPIDSLLRFGVQHYIDDFCLNDDLPFNIYLNRAQHLRDRPVFVRHTAYDDRAAHLINTHRATIATTVHAALPLTQCCVAHKRDICPTRSYGATRTC